LKYVGSVSSAELRADVNSETSARAASASAQERMAAKLSNSTRRSVDRSDWLTTVSEWFYNDQPKAGTSRRTTEAIGAQFASAPASHANGVRKEKIREKSRFPQKTVRDLQMRRPRVV
jgi:hypothetical protein